MRCKSVHATPKQLSVPNTLRTAAASSVEIGRLIAWMASEFGGSWPPGVPLQIHMMEADEWAVEDLPAARELVETIEGAELFLYAGDRHLFADSSLPDYDENAAKLLKKRVLSFLDTIE